MGRYRDRLKHSATAYGREQVARAGDVAHETMEAARQEVGKAMGHAASSPKETKGNPATNPTALKNNGVGA